MAEEVLVSGSLLAGPGGLFEKIRSHVATRTGQGQVFERLIKAFLSEDPLFKERFGQLWLWSEWPGRQGERDSGIDLVAKERDGGLCAVQCKFYGASEYIGRDEIDSFLARSGQRPFTARLFVSTTERWSTTAEKVLAGQQVPVQRIGIAELEASPFDWSRFDPSHPDQLPRQKAKQLRDRHVRLCESGRGRCPPRYSPGSRPSFAALGGPTFSRLGRARGVRRGTRESVEGLSARSLPTNWDTTDLDADVVDHCDGASVEVCCESGQVGEQDHRLFVGSSAGTSAEQDD